MNRKIFKWGVFLWIGGMLLVSCSKDDKNGPDDDQNQATGKYVLLTAESGSGSAGYYAAYDALPNGNVDNIGGYSLQARAYGGFRHYGNWIFNRATLAGETGVVRYNVGASGKLEQTGFIKCGSSAQNLVVDENTGFYFDADRGKTKIQKFNPTSMQRTGEIDLSPLIEKGNGISTNVYTGNQTIAAKEGKLYVNITYSRTGGSGHNDNTRNFTMAVIDIATEKLEKTITHKFVKNQGHSPSEFPAWTQGTDGTLYFVTTGWDYDEQNIMVPQPSGVYRIKAGETDFDQDWFLDGEKLDIKDGQLWSVRELNGKLYVDVSKKPVELPSFGNLADPMYTVYAVDPNSMAATEITGFPLTVFGHSTGNLEVVDNNLFIRVISTANNYNGYYQLNADGKTASAAFNVSRGGQAKGFTRLTGE
ncbi:hypothetical protein GCM10023231_15160 [Olivibacter ginsenosidimutans]|uniref:DUF4374 domain-containing protein n=1 Tax=Olivibacter ginsenosidimutans TaxID=1176537 RepID=A0ABP9AY80_9SPHI